VNNWSFQKLFNRRPTSATVGLSIAAISFLATILQGVISLLTSRNVFFFDFISGQDFNGGGLTWKQAVIGITWAIAGLLACYFALEPRNAARFTVVVTSGVKLFAFIAYSSVVNLPTWQYILTIVIAALPVVLLLSKSSNAYYGRNQ
jgi:hypothetical protein